jgi:hypothetical protein
MPIVTWMTYKFESTNGSEARISLTGFNSITFILRTLKTSISRGFLTRLLTNSVPSFHLPNTGQSPFECQQSTVHRASHTSATRLCTDQKTEALLGDIHAMSLRGIHLSLPSSLCPVGWAVASAAASSPSLGLVFATTDPNLYLAVLLRVWIRDTITLDLLWHSGKCRGSRMTLARVQFPDRHLLAFWPWADFLTSLVFT